MSVNEKNGFTMLEALMGIIVMGVIAMLILQMILLMSKSTGELFNQRQSILYVTQVQRDLLATEHITAQSDSARLEKHNEEIIYYGKRGNKVIRARTQHLIGGDVMLTNVEDVEFVFNDEILSMIVKYANEEIEKEMVLGTPKFE